MVVLLGPKMGSTAFVPPGDGQDYASMASRGNVRA